MDSAVSPRRCIVWLLGGFAGFALVRAGDPGAKHAGAAGGFCLPPIFHRSLGFHPRHGSRKSVIAAPPGCDVNFHFAETGFGSGNFTGGGAGSRGFDMFTEAGGSGRALALPVFGP